MEAKNTVMTNDEVIEVKCQAIENEPISTEPKRLVEIQLKAIALAQAEISFKAGIRKGIRLYAWWQDGIQYVGTTGSTLRDALQEYED